MDKIKITNAQWRDGPTGKKEEVICATIDGQTMWVPKDPSNRHYAAILEWVADGNTIEEAD